MNGKTYHCVLCYRLGVPLFSISKPCLACSRVFAGDIYGEYVVSCTGIIGIKHRHNVVHYTLVDICYLSGISTGKEVDIGLEEGCDKPLRPADMLLYSWVGGLDVCVDLTGSLRLTQTGMADFAPGCTVIDAAQCKRVKYKAKCATIGYGFLLFSFSSLGELEKDAVTLLKRIQKFSMTQDIRARDAIHIFNKIGFVVAKGSGRNGNRGGNRNGGRGGNNNNSSTNYQNTQNRSNQAINGSRPPTWNQPTPWAWHQYCASIPPCPYPTAPVSPTSASISLPPTRPSTPPQPTSPSVNPTSAPQHSSNHDPKST
ncbi:hypothetical protein Tco_1059547 [Tanacetum coccineum]